MINLHPPIIIPPESLSKNYVSNESFNLKENLTISFKLKSANSPDKELSFGIFLADAPNSYTFGAPTVRSGLLDYSTKGEVGEGISKNGEKLTINIKDIETDLLIDHVFPYSTDHLCKNQNPFNTPGFKNVNGFSILFDSTQNIYKEFVDAYNNIYFDKILIKDLLTNEEVNDLSVYTHPIFIQIGLNSYVLDSLYDSGKSSFDILNINSKIIRISIENNSKLLKIDILDPDTSVYKPLLSKFIKMNLQFLKNLKLGYVLSSPVKSYDKTKQANFEIVDFHIQGKLINL